MLKHFPAARPGLTTAIICSLIIPPAGAQQGPRGATSVTREANAAVLRELPFADRTAFDQARRGFIAPLPAGMIRGRAGNLVWDSGKFSFITEAAAAPDTVNPSLWRQSQLITIAGLFEVTEGIYQVRNQDLSNMTIVEGKEGITIFDPLISVETAGAALDLYYRHRPRKPVVAVVYTHSHVDHFGGVRGVVDEADVKRGKVRIYAPLGFLEEAVQENVMAGNAMARRASYMYGNLLPASPRGNVGAGLGTTTSAGSVSLIPPTDIIRKTGERRVIDGLTYEFIYAPETEAPSEMLFLIREKRALNAAEEATHTLHNTYTLRGAKIRNPLAWSKFLNQAIDLWGDQADVLFGMHHWPVWGKAALREHLERQRDMYRYINDETLRLANRGYTMTEIAEQIRLPRAIASHFSNRGYYGSLSHNVKATYVFHLGWFNGNPATLHELPPVEAAKRYVGMMGGTDALLKKARQYYDKGEYRWVAEVVNHAVFAEPNNMAAKNLQADALEQLGYQAESGPWRNFYLTGAQELRQGLGRLPAPNAASPDSVRAMGLDLLFDFLAMRLNGSLADGKRIVLNFDFPDVKQKAMVEMVNGVLNHTLGRQATQADATIVLSRETLNQIVLKQVTLQDALRTGSVRLAGNTGKFSELFSYLDSFDPWFPIVTP